MIEVCLTHPGENKVHLHLRHPLPHAGAHAHAKGNEAVRVMLPQTAAGRLGAEPPLRDEDLRVGKLGLIMKDRVMTQVELSLKKRGQWREDEPFFSALSRASVCHLQSAGSSFIPSWGTSSFPQRPHSLKRSVRFQVPQDTGWWRHIRSSVPSWFSLWGFVNRCDWRQRQQSGRWCPCHHPAPHKKKKNNTHNCSI